MGPRRARGAFAAKRESDIDHAIGHAQPRGNRWSKVFAIVTPLAFLR